MAKIQLTLSTNYVRQWGAWEGVREIVQNALDAADDGYEMKVSHSGDTLKVSSIGARLDKRVWLMGTSSKAGGGYRGHFGEGLKLGVLCLVRAGHDVRIVNRDESWSPKLEESEVFGGDDVLTIYTRALSKDDGAFTVEIGGVDKEAWALMRPRFLALDPQKDEDVIDTYYAKVLTSASMRGKVFVKGIFVQSNPSLAAGYDFKRIETDRDRKMVDAWDLSHHAGQAWQEAMTRKVVMPSKILDMLENNAPDVEHLGGMYANTEIASALAEVFAERHGEGAMPVTNMAEAREVEHYGKQGVVLPQKLVEALRRVEPMNLEATRAAFKNAAQKTYGWKELSVEEQEVYRSALDLVENGAAKLEYAPVEARLNVVDFGDPNLRGTHESTGGVGQIKIAKSVLSSFEDTLQVLVHEVAHDRGGDGEKDHEHAEGKLFAAIVGALRVAAPKPEKPKAEAPKVFTKAMKLPKMEDPRPANAVAYITGFMAGLQGLPLSEDGPHASAPEFAEGHARGAQVKRGEARAPSWMR